jgi:hypothetical protein
MSQQHVPFRVATHESGGAVFPLEVEFIILTYLEISDLLSVQATSLSNWKRFNQAAVWKAAFHVTFANSTKKSGGSWKKKRSGKASRNMSFAKGDFHKGRFMDYWHESIAKVQAKLTHSFGTALRAGRMQSMRKQCIKAIHENAIKHRLASRVCDCKHTNMLLTYQLTPGMKIPVTENRAPRTRLKCAQCRKICHGRVHFCGACCVYTAARERVEERDKVEAAVSVKAGGEGEDVGEAEAEAEAEVDGAAYCSAECLSQEHRGHATFSVGRDTAEAEYEQYRVGCFDCGVICALRSRVAIKSDSLFEHADGQKDQHHDAEGTWARARPSSCNRLPGKDSGCIKLVHVDFICFKQQSVFRSQLLSPESQAELVARRGTHDHHFH